jgi:hypothetical protein
MPPRNKPRFYVPVRRKVNSVKLNGHYLRHMQTKFYYKTGKGFFGRSMLRWEDSNSVDFKEAELESWDSWRALEGAVADLRDPLITQLGEQLLVFQEERRSVELFQCLHAVSAKVLMRPMS